MTRGRPFDLGSKETKETNVILTTIQSLEKLYFPPGESLSISQKLENEIPIHSTLTLHLHSL